MKNSILIASLFAIALAACGKKEEAPVEPAAPAVTEPAPAATEPAPAEPTPAEPAATEPAPTEPAATPAEEEKK
ncbi:MAG: hypothetical protein KJ798_03815 [Gammaproteobacteria bacterium]|nr:hypothetical protein [Gammaproteobacteria bacterium]MBU0849487.1 hypothetical protein [Gammaproteobacteria bacterium]MBU1268098.1 hypothetical protein [Gammaproteobacteria bacterium]MBU1779492.1 hypothetical protein [Gammaproteobacteria bacterium]MBU2088392.1 hypothetical protein [Gammaproteobacteria bacterium]